MNNISSVAVTVIIPVYNSADYIRTTLKYISGQTFNNIEIICVDDGSIDDSCEIISELQKSDDRIKLIKQEHEGVASARNRGLKEAKGKYISFIDSDDYTNVNLYTKVIEIIEKNNPDIVMFNAGFIDDKSKKIFNETFFDIRTIRNHENKFSLHTYKDFNLLFYTGDSVCNKVYNREFLSKNNLYFISESSFEDRIFNFTSLLSAEKISVLNERLYLYRLYRKGSVNSCLVEKNSTKIFDVFESINHIEKLIFTKFPDLKESFFDYITQILSYYFFKAPKKIKKAFYKKIKIKFSIMQYWNCNNEVLSKNYNYINYKFALNHNYISYYIEKKIFDFVFFKLVLFFKNFF